MNTKDFYEKSLIINDTNLLLKNLFKLIIKKHYNKFNSDKLNKKDFDDDEIFNSYMKDDIKFKVIARLYVKFNIIHTEGYFDAYKEYYPNLFKS